MEEKKDACKRLLIDCGKALAEHEKIDTDYPMSAHTLYNEAQHNELVKRSRPLYDRYFNDIKELQQLNCEPIENIIDDGTREQEELIIGNLFFKENLIDTKRRKRFDIEEQWDNPEHQKLLNEMNIALIEMYKRQENYIDKYLGGRKFPKD